MEAELAEESDREQTEDIVPEQHVPEPEPNDEPGKPGPVKNESVTPERTTAIPDVKDGTAPRPQVGVPTLSPDAIRSRARRVFTPRANGSLKVSDAIFKEWNRKGSVERKNLEMIFAQCGYNPVPRLNHGRADA